MGLSGKWVVPRRAQGADEDGVCTAEIVRADDGSVGVRFLRSGGATAAPFEVTRLVPQGTDEQSGAVEIGDHFRAVNGRDVTALDDAAVAGLFRGAPGTTLTLLLCDGPASLHKRASAHLAIEANLKEIEELEARLAAAKATVAQQSAQSAETANFKDQLKKIQVQFQPGAADSKAASDA